MQSLKKIFKSDKKYYLEIDEIKESQPVQEASKAAEKVTDAVQEKVAEIKESQPVQEASKAAEKATDKAQEKVAEIKESTGANNNKKGKKVSKKGSQNSEEKSQAKSGTSLENSGGSSYEPPFWVAAMYKANSNSNNSNGSGGEQTFSTDNLMPTITNSRRRPGPSLNKFKDMASKAKTPRG